MLSKLVPLKDGFYIRIGGVRWKNYHPSRKTRPHGTTVPPTTDVELYKTLDISHLHRWDYQDTLRSFNLKYDNLMKSRELSSQRSSEKPLAKPQSISISPYVPRSPTDILNSIASGLKKDPGAPDYRFHDDPYLTPYNHISSREYILGKEAGKAAARFVFDNHPELFMNNRIEMVPTIPSFLPKAKVYPNKVTPDTLRIFLQGNMIPEAIECYEALNDVEEDLKVELLQKAAYFADKYPSITEDYNMTQGLFQDPPTHWKAGGFAESLSKELKDQGLGKLILLYGYSRHGRYEDALILFEELKALNVPLSTEAYNSYIRAHVEDSLKRKVTFSEIKLSTTGILEEMSQSGVRPDSRTLYWILRGISRVPFRSEDYSETCEHALSLISEFKNNLDTKPSVGSYEALLNIFYPKSVNSSDILRDIIAELEDTQLYLVDPEETTFLKTAMFLCFIKLSDPSLAWRLHNKITMYGDNHVLLNHAGDHQAYYNYFLSLQIAKSSFVSAMDFYDKFSPHTFFCSWLNYEKIVMKIERLGQYKYLPSIWSDLVTNDFCRVNIRLKYEMISRILSIFENGKDFLEVEDEEARSKVVNAAILIAKDSFFDFILPLKKLSDFKEASSVLSSSMKIILEKGAEHLESYLDSSDAIMNFTLDKMAELSGPPFTEEIIQLYFDNSLLNFRKDSCLRAVNYASIHGFDNKIKLARSFVESFELSERETVMLNTMFSHVNEWTPIVFNESE